MFQVIPVTKFLIGVLIILGFLYAIKVFASYGLEYPRLPDLWQKIRLGANRLHFIVGVIAAIIVCIYLLRLGIYVLRSW